MQDHKINNKRVRYGITLALIAGLFLPVANAQPVAEIQEVVRGCQRVPELSSRLACYDRAFPPMAESAAEADVPAQRDAGVATSPIPAPTPQPAPAPPPVPTRQAQPAPVPEPAPEPVVQIVEVQKPSLRTTHFHAADGRVFIQSNATRIIRWPDAPFEVEIQSGTFGSTFLKFLDSNIRIRVSVGE